MIDQLLASLPIKFYLGFSVFALLSYILYDNFIKKRKNLPQGPTPLPFLGNLLQMDQTHPEKTFIELSKIYGSIFTFWFGNEANIVITDYQLIKKALVKQGETFSGRQENRIFDILQAQGGKPFTYGLIFAHGDFWKEQRRFSLHVLRDFGFGRNIMEQKIMIEVNHLVTHIRDLLNGQKTNALDPHWPIQLCVASIISTVLMGHRYERDDTRFVKLNQLLDEQFELLQSVRVAMLFSYPWLRFLPIFGRFGYTELEKEQNAFYEFLHSEIALHKEVFVASDDHSEPSNFTEAYLREIKRRNDLGDHNSVYSEHQLAACLLDLWAAGMETTVTTLGWALLYMIYYPHVQKRCQQEIIAAVANRDPPVLTMADQRSLPYTTATINEIQRMANIIPIMIQHSLTEDVEFAGYKLSQGTVILPQVSAVLCDPSIFPNPKQFDPTRFLNANEDTLKNCEELIPFSMGKRECLGKSLARTELFLIFATLLQKFKFEAVDPNNLPSLEPRGGITKKTKPYELIVTEV